MSAERPVEAEEKQGVWKSRLFKGGLVATIIGAAAGIAVIAEVGLGAMLAGGGWAWWKRKGK